MNNKQIDLLKKLNGVLGELYDEALNDDNFNNKLAELGIFNLSIDDCMNKIVNELE